MSKTKKEERRDVATAILAALVGSRAPGAVSISDIQRNAMVDAAAVLTDALLEHLEKTTPDDEGKMESATLPL